jgi:hypothetical protein
MSERRRASIAIDVESEAEVAKAKGKPEPKKYPPGSMVEFTLDMLGPAQSVEPTRRRRFLYARDRADLIWRCDFADAEISDIQSPADPDRFKYKSPAREVDLVRVLAKPEVVQPLTGPPENESRDFCEVDESAAVHGAILPMPRRDRRLIGLVRRCRRIDAALNHMREAGLGQWVTVLYDAYARQDMIIEDGGEVVPAGGDYDGPVVNFGGARIAIREQEAARLLLGGPVRVAPSGPSARSSDIVQMREIRPAKKVPGTDQRPWLLDKRGNKVPNPEHGKRKNGERQEKPLTNGETVLKGGHVLGQEDAVGSVDVPGLARLPHPIARRNMEEALEHACRAYEDARAKTDPGYRVPRGPRIKVITQAEAARRARVSRATVQRWMRSGRLRTIRRSGKDLVEWPPIESATERRTRTIYAHPSRL